MVVRKKKKQNRNEGMDGESQCVKFSWESKYEAYGSRKSCSSTDSRRRATYGADVHVRVFFVHLGGVGKKKKDQGSIMA